jgi:large-conductance mechanosensitive channel
MNKALIHYLGIAVVTFMVSFSNVGTVQAGSKDMVAQKREKFEDDSVESMKDLMAKREEDNQAYKKKMMSNSDKTVMLLEEIRDLLKQLNEENKE